MEPVVEAVAAKERRLVMVDLTKVHLVWASVVDGLQNALPQVAGDQADERMNWMFAALQSGRAQLWLGFSDFESGEISFAAVTTIVEDVCSRTRSLLIYALASFGHLAFGTLRDGLEKVKEFARSRGCEYIGAYTRLESVAKAFECLGGDVDCRFLRLDV